MRLTYHPEAEVELIEAARFYEERLPGLGRQFIASIDAAGLAIARSPGRWRLIHADIRRYLMSRFPFAIYYRATEREVRVLAVKHHRRHPDYWRQRLRE
jgi:plasmid stabilization system protein ParE